MIRDRRRVVANIFADAAKYTLTVGVIGNILAEKFVFSIGVVLGVTVLCLIILAYFVTPKDKKEE